MSEVYRNWDIWQSHNGVRLTFSAPDGMSSSDYKQGKTHMCRMAAECVFPVQKTNWLMIEHDVTDIATITNIPQDQRDELLAKFIDAVGFRSQEEIDEVKAEDAQ